MKIPATWKLPWFILLTLLLVSLPMPALASPPKTYLFAVLPQRPPVAMYATWRPFLDNLERELGITLKLKLYETMPQFEADLKNGEGDFVFATPPQIVLAHQSQQYQPLVRGSRAIAGVLFVKKHSAITKLADLDNKEVAFVGSRNV